MTTSNFTELLQQHAGSFEKVVPLQNDKLLRMDFTEANPELTADVLSNTGSFSNYIYAKLHSAGARYGIGGYAEHRTLYERSSLFGASRKTSFSTENAAEPFIDEPRRLHLGIDIWGKAFTPVIAPLDGIVHSFAFNNAFGDYGATIILTHRLEEVTFYTLYGHLSLNSIKNLQEGMRIQKGYVFAEFGIPQENGSWPPHLHFQLILDMQGKKGDYPGVCKYSEREVYLANCPDPDLILHMVAAAQAE